jgi:hypothetical protein
MTATREDVYEAIAIIETVWDLEDLAKIRAAVVHQEVEIRIPTASIQYEEKA